MNKTTITVDLDIPRIIIFSYLIPYLISFYFLKKSTLKRPLLYSLIITVVAGSLLAYLTVQLLSSLL